jgi:hypothetical protein
LLGFTAKTHGLVLLVAVLLSLFYVTQLVQKATMTLELETSRKTIFKVYWPDEAGLYTEKLMSQIVIRPGITWYSLRICNLGKVDKIRIDTSEKPATVTLKHIYIQQAGYPLQAIDSIDQRAEIIVHEGIKEIANGPDGLVVVPANGDPQLIYNLPSLDHTFPWLQEGWRIAAIFIFVYGVAFATASLWDNFSYVPILLTFIAALIVVMAGISKFDTHPDEPVHVAAAAYYQDHTLPAKIGDPAIRQTYSAYGVSRLHSGEIVYLLAGKFMRLLQPFHLQPYQSFRYFNVLLFFILLLLSVRYFRAGPLLLPLLISPQIWYVFSYADSDAFALFILLIAAWQMCLPGTWFNRFISDGISRKTVVPLLFLGLLTGLSLLVKKNFYFFHLFTLGYLGWRAFFLEQNRKVFLQRCMVIGLIGLSVAGIWRAADYKVNGFDKDAKLLQCREDFAKPMYKPGTPLEKKHIYLQMKERGTTLKHFLDIDRWGEKSFRSSFGVYGYTSISASFAYYDFVRMAGVALLTFLTVLIVFRGGLPGITLMLLTATAAVSLIIVAMHHAWTVDFQAQGRYFLPVIAMFSVLVYQTRECLENSLLQLAVLVLFFLSSYNFIFVGLHDIVKFGG